MTRCDGLARKPACSRREGGRGSGGSVSAVQAAWRGQGPLVQKTLKTASTYAEKSYRFTRIQFELIKYLIILFYFRLLEITSTLSFLILLIRSTIEYSRIAILSSLYL